MWRNLAWPKIVGGSSWGILLDAANGAFEGKDSKWKRWSPATLISSKTLIARPCIASAWKSERMYKIVYIILIEAYKQDVPMK